MNNDPLSSPQPPPQPRPASPVSERFGATLQVPRRSFSQPAPPTGPDPETGEQQVTPPTPPGSVQPNETPASEPAQSLEASGRRKTLEPINEAEVLRARALADEEVARAQPAPPPPPTAPVVSKSVLADEIERGPDNAPVPVVETSIQDFLPPVLDKNGNIDNKVDDDAVSWPRLIIAGIALPVLWIAIDNALGWWVSSALFNQMNTTRTYMDAVREWSWLLSTLPFISIGLTALIGFFILNYPQKWYRALLSVGIVTCFVGLVQLLPHIPGIGTYTTSTAMFGVIAASLNNSLLLQFVDMRAVWVTAAAAVVLGIVSVIGIHAILKGLRFKVPGLVVVIAIVIISGLPLAIKVPLVAAERDRIEVLLNKARE